MPARQCRVRTGPHTRRRRLRNLCLANTASGKIRLTLARSLAILRAMRHVVRMVAAIGFALSTRRDLLLEILALRHQLRVLVRSNRRFRPSDRLLWLVLRRCGLGGETRWCWSSRPRSTVGIAMGSIDVGAAARDVLADHASIQNVEP